MQMRVVLDSFGQDIKSYIQAIDKDLPVETTLIKIELGGPLSYGSVLVPKEHLIHALRKLEII